MDDTRTAYIKIDRIESHERVPKEHIVNITLRVIGCSDTADATMIVSNMIQKRVPSTQTKDEANE